MTDSSPPTSWTGSFFPGRPPIDSYGDGGFRFAGMSHLGSLLCLPGGVHGWDLCQGETLALRHFEIIFAQADTFEFLLLGTGEDQVFPGAQIKAAFAEAGLALEVMNSGAAARTYNILLGEGRPVGAALIAVS